MKVKESRQKDGCLILDGRVLNGAQEAFKEKRYIEAYALLHAHIEFEMKLLCDEKYYQMNRVKASTSHIGKAIRDPLGPIFHKKPKFLFCNDVIDSDIFSKLTEFNEARNKVIHRLVFRTELPYIYDKAPLKDEVLPKICITEKELHAQFDSGLKVAQLLHERMRSLFQGMSPEEYRKMIEESNKLIYDDITASRTPEGKTA